MERYWDDETLTRGRRRYRRGDNTIVLNLERPMVSLDANETISVFVELAQWKLAYEEEKEKNERMRSAVTDWRYNVEAIRDMMKISIVTDKANRFLIVKETDLVRDVKRQFGIWWKTSPDIILQFGEDILEDDKRLADYKVGGPRGTTLKVLQDYQEEVDVQPEKNTETSTKENAPPTSTASEMQTQLQALLEDKQKIEARNRELEELVNKFSVICVNCRMTQ